MKDTPSTIVVHPDPGVSPEQSRDARARAWAFIYLCWDTKRGEQHVVTTRKSGDAEKETTEHGKGGDLA